MTRRGQWQLLQVEFKTPIDARTVWLALEKGTSKPAEIDALLDEIRLEPIERLGIVARYRLVPIPKRADWRASTAIRKRSGWPRKPMLLT